MTVETYINSYSWELAQNLWEEILSKETRRPKKFSYLRDKNDPLKCSTDADASESIIYFAGCPFKLKDKRMVDWLRVIFLWMPPECYRCIFSQEDYLMLLIEAVEAELNGKFWVYSPDGVPKCLTPLFFELKKFDEGIQYLQHFEDAMPAIFSDDNVKTELQIESWEALLYCRLAKLGLAIYGNLPPEDIQHFLLQIQEILNFRVEQAEEDGEEVPNLELEYNFMEEFIKLIPLIESRNNIILNFIAYDLAGTYYDWTNRQQLAEKYNTMAAEIEDEVNHLLELQQQQEEGNM